MKNDDIKYQVIVSERAAEMLVSHIRFVARVSQQAAEDLRKKIIESAKTLEELPERGSWLIDPNLPRNKYRKLVVESRYMLIYQVKDCIVYIDSIIDCRRDYPWIIY
jgi:hypothetical protein